MKILVPLDKSNRDGIVLPYSANAARAHQGSLVLLTVMTRQRSIMPGGAREAEAYLMAVAEGIREQGLEAEYALRKGEVAGTIVSFADEAACDMIVMASRGRAGIGKLVLGSVADTVLSTCGKPVLLLSESSNGVKLDDTVRQQSAYLATVLWDRKARGHMSAEDVQTRFDLLGAEGLDRAVLTSTYRALEEQGGIPFGWLDIDFQLNTLRTYLPERIPDDTADDLDGLLEQKAA